MPYLPHLRPDHDEILVARFAVGDADGSEAETARRLIADCPACAELAADIRGIAAATVALPEPRRTRDFRLTDADAARLRRHGLRRLLGRFGEPRLSFTGPLAAGFATLGIAGLLLAGISSGPGGFSIFSSAAARPSDNAERNAVDLPAAGGAAAAPSPGLGDGSRTAASAAPSAAPAAGSESDLASAVPSPEAGFGATASGSAASPVPGAAAAPSAAPGPTEKGLASLPAETFGGAPGPPLLVILSILLLVVGLGLGALRIIGGRLA